MQAKNTMYLYTDTKYIHIFAHAKFIQVCDLQSLAKLSYEVFKDTHFLCCYWCCIAVEYNIQLDCDNMMYVYIHII